LPAGLPPRVVALARELTAQAHGPYDKAVALMRHLARFRYTTDLPAPGAADPLSGFLFDFRAGHCEYFATALAILLRAVGVPSREVNGFYGGEWNDFGNYLAVRQMDAHAWVEAWFPGHGWVTLDPTPGAAARGELRSGSWLHKLQQMIDTVELAWHKHMV